MVDAALGTGADLPHIGLLFMAKAFVPLLELAAIVGLLATVVGPRFRREDVIVTTGFFAGAAEIAGRWSEEDAVSVLEVGLLRVTTGFSFTGAGGGGGGIGTRRGPDGTKFCGPEVAGVRLMPEVIGRRLGAADVVARDMTVWERIGPLTSWAEPGREAIVGVFPLTGTWGAGTVVTGSFLPTRAKDVARLRIWLAVEAAGVEAVLACAGLRARVEDDAEVELDGLTLGFMLRLARRFDVDCGLETPFDLISRYFFIVGVSGAVKLRISCIKKATVRTQGN